MISGPGGGSSAHLDSGSLLPAVGRKVVSTPGPEPYYRDGWVTIYHGLVIDCHYAQVKP